VSRGEIAAGLARSFGSDRKDAARQYEKRTQMILSLAGNPQQMSAALSHQGAIATHAPNTAQAMQIASSRGVAFLASKIPQRPPAGPLAAAWKPSQTEIALFNRYYEAVESPTTILKQASAGTLTPEAIDAVRTVHPALFAQMQQALLSKLSTTKTVPYKSRLMLSLLLSQPVDGTTTQAAIAANQASMAAPPQSPTQQSGAIAPTQGGLSNLTLSNRSQTPAQASQNRGP
jgi:hypothetical protein